MLCSQQVVLLLIAFMADPTFLLRLQSESSGSVLRSYTLSDVLNDFLFSMKARINFTDFFVPRECLEDNAALFKVFLDSQTQPVTLWNDGRRHHYICRKEPCEMVRRSLFYILYIVCGKYDMIPLWISTLTDYFMTAFVVAENTTYTRGRNGIAMPAMPFLPPYPRASGRHVIRFANASVFVASEFERGLITHQNFRKGLWLEGQRTLHENRIHLTCTSDYGCEHPSFNVTLELLTHRNASVTVHRDPHHYIKERYLSAYVNSLSAHPHRYEPSILSGVHPFGSTGFSFYVRKRDPVSKEAIFLLPFSGEVWLGLLASCLSLVLTFGLIPKIRMIPNVNIFTLVFPMVAAFCQQGVKLHKSLLMTQPTRLLYGLMALMFFVMSTAFKGRLTSLLDDLPLQGEATRFVSFEEINRKGYRLCMLEVSSLDVTPRAAAYFPNVHYGSRCYQISKGNRQNSRSIKIAEDGRDTFFTYSSPTGPSEALRRELLGRGYVETEEIAFSLPVGPEMRASSVYRRDFEVTLSHGIEAGLYVRNANLALYKSRSLHEANSEKAEGHVLCLGDLRPFFLAWCLGVSFSILALVGEALLFRAGRCNRRERVRMIMAHPFTRRLRSVLVRKKRVVGPNSTGN